MIKILVMIYFFLICMLCLRMISLNAQQNYFDSLSQDLGISESDTLLMMKFSVLASTYQETKPDSSMYYGKKALILARELKFRTNEVLALDMIGGAYQGLGDYPRSLETFLSAIEIAEDPKKDKNILPDKYVDFFYKCVGHRGIKILSKVPMFQIHILSLLYGNLGLLYENVIIYDKELVYIQKAIQLAEKVGDLFNLGEYYSILGRVYLFMKKQDSALIYLQKASDIDLKLNHQIHGSVLLNLGRCYLAMGNKKLASEYVRMSIVRSNEDRYPRGVVAGNLMLADFCEQEGKKDSSLFFANTAHGIAQRMNSPDLLLRTYTELATIYRSSATNDSAVKYQELIIKLKDSLFNSKQAQQFKNIDFDEQQRHQEIEAAKGAYRNRLRIFGLLSGLACFILVAIILWRNNLYRKRAFAQLQKQKQETDIQKHKVEQTLDELKATQSQLIQSAKMASLGELTAGIAHEIQNPLNFVNNFSEVNTELIDELREELKTGKVEDAFSISTSIKENGQKIIHHGKRADAIVKGMLQHSIAGTGQKELANINAIVDECLRLSYNGLRAKDKSFKANLQTDFDERIEKFPLIQQDMVRVFVNLFNNAFYAINEKSKQQIEGYEPTVLVSTKKINGKVEIRVKDNGNGIQQKVLDKIFQPFFTTKPTGQGIGLGLSLSYDIIIAHGGGIKVETEEGKFTEFVIQIPEG